VQPVQPFPSSSTSSMAAARPLNPKRGRWLIISGVVLMVVGFVCGTLLGGFGALRIRSIQSAVDDLILVNTPTGEEVELRRGTYELWLVEDGGRVAVRPVGTPVIITSAETGETVPVQPMRVTKTWNLGGKNAVGIGSVDIPETGSYFVESELRRGRIGIGNIGIADTIIGAFAIAGGVATALLFGVSGIVLLIIGIVMRSSTKRAIAQDPALHGGPH